MDDLNERLTFEEMWAMYRMALKTDMHIVDTETCAIIWAMRLVWGNHEAFTRNNLLVCELSYAQKRFNIQPDGTANDESFRTSLFYYIVILRAQQCDGRVPDDINKIFKERYGVCFNKS